MTKTLPIQLVSAELLSYVRANAGWVDYKSFVAETTRAAAFIIEANEFLKSEDRAHGNVIAMLFERLPFPSSDDATSASVVPTMAPLSTLYKHIVELLGQPCCERTAWQKMVVSNITRSVPTMLTNETMRYYKWLGQQANGEGCIVELGTWLGSSTRCFCEGLAKETTSSNQIFVYDSFIWENWMDDFVDRRMKTRWPSQGDDFFDLFMQGVHGFENTIVAQRCWIGNEDGGPRSGLQWTNKKPIQLLCYDMGSDASVLAALWRVFSPFFIPNKTLFVLNEYGKTDSSAIWEFCSRHSDHLVPCHKPYGSTKAFLYV
jgi:hypothetical protein